MLCIQKTIYNILVYLDRFSNHKYNVWNALWTHMMLYDFSIVLQ